MTSTLIMLLLICIGIAYFSVCLISTLSLIRKHSESIKRINSMDKMCFSCRFMTFNDCVLKCNYKLPFFLEDQHKKIVSFNNRNMTFGKLPKNEECEVHEYSISKYTIYNEFTRLKYDALRILYGME